MKKYLILTSVMLLFSLGVCGQGFNFKKIKYNIIKGAPQLSEPQFIKDEKGNLIVMGKMGHAAPALFDWDKDGKTDLLIGDFGNGTNSFLHIFKNLGTNRKPIYSKKSIFAKDKNGEIMNITGA